jgi:uncharacterized protein (DUF433 family)
VTVARKKLIEVALPLAAINEASAREKSIRHGHPSTLHLWWARRPLAAARAVIFAQMVDDPSSLPDLFPTEAKQQKERERLFRIIEDLVQWENTTNEAVLERARAEIWQSWRRACAENADRPRARELFDRKKRPAFHDPFASGGALPLEFRGDEPVRWFPEESRRIVVDPARRFGQPVLTREGVPTRILARAYKAEGSYVSVARWYALDVDAVKAAVAFERRISRKAA